MPDSIQPAEPTATVAYTIDANQQWQPAADRQNSTPADRASEFHTICTDKNRFRAGKSQLPQRQVVEQQYQPLRRTSSEGLHNSHYNYSPAVTEKQRALFHQVLSIAQNNR
jgi:hypothetical protein